MANMLTTVYFARPVNEQANQIMEVRSFLLLTFCSESFLSYQVVCISVCVSGCMHKLMRIRLCA